MALIGIDTNVLIRTFVRDDQVQSDKVLRFVSELAAEDVLFVNLAVLLEFSWTLRSFYKYPRAMVLNALESLLERHDLELEYYDVVGDAVVECRDNNCEFSDAVISFVNRSTGCLRTMTFDKEAAVRVPGMELLA